MKSFSILILVALFCYIELAISSKHVAVFSALISNNKRRRRRVVYHHIIKYYYEHVLISSCKKKKRRRRPRKNYLNAPWSVLLRMDELITDSESAECEIFRRRFRVPYPIFDVILRIVRQEQWFKEGRKAGTYIFILSYKLFKFFY